MESDLTNVFGDDWEDLEFQISCGVCLEPFEDPRTLTCSHSLCNNCLVGIYRRNPSCPFCRSPFSVPFPITNESLLELTQRFLREMENRKSQKSGAMEIDVPQDSPLLMLPKEIISEIYVYLTYKDLARCCIVCKSLQQTAEHSWLWREYCTMHFPFCDTESSGKSWRNIFRVNQTLKVGWDQGRPKDFKMTPWRAHKNYINCFDLYRRNVVSGGADNDLNIWAFGNTKPLRTLKSHTGLINCVKFNEIWVVSGSADSTSKVFDTTAGNVMNTLQHNGPVNSLFFNDTVLWTASTDNYVRSWDIRTGKTNASINPHNSSVLKVEPGPNSTIITNNNNSIRVFDTRTNTQLHNMNLNGITCSYYTGENILAAGTSNGNLAIYDISSNTLLHNSNIHSQAINCIHADGDCVVTGSNDSTCKIWNIKTNTLVHTLQDHQGPVNTVQMDGYRVVSGGADMCMKVWNRNKGVRLYSLLGGSRQERGNNPPHPTRAGCSTLKYDQSRIVGVFNSLLRVYSFSVEN